MAHMVASPLRFHDMPMAEPAAVRTMATIRKKSEPLPIVSQLLEPNMPFAALRMGVGDEPLVRMVETWSSVVTV